MGKWGEILSEVRDVLIKKYGDISEITVPLEFDKIEGPVEAFLKAFQWGYVEHNKDSSEPPFLWKGNLREGFPIFTDMVELLAVAADEFLNNKG